jgi:hypothetical protein
MSYFPEELDVIKNAGHELLCARACAVHNETFNLEGRVVSILTLFTLVQSFEWHL